MFTLSCGKFSPYSVTGAKAENGCIALKFRIDPDDEEICERYAALFRLVGNFGKKIEDVE